MVEGGGVGEGVGAAVGMNGVGVGYQYGTGWPDEPVAPTVVDEPAHPATAATTNNRAPTSFGIPTAFFDWSPNGWRLSGAEGVRCSRGLGGGNLARVTTHLCAARARENRTRRQRKRAK
jgi:hypothetical protein